MYEYLDVQREFVPDSLNEYENLVAYLERFEALEPIKEYQSSDRFKKYPINGPEANWCGGPPPEEAASE